MPSFPGTSPGPREVGPDVGSGVKPAHHGLVPYWRSTPATGPRGVIPPSWGYPPRACKGFSAGGTLPSWADGRHWHLPSQHRGCWGPAWGTPQHLVMLVSCFPVVLVGFCLYLGLVGREEWEIFTC